MNNLDSISEQVSKDLSARDKAREKMLPLCRDVIRHSSNAIRAVHRQEFEKAGELLKTARSLLTDAEEAVKGFSELNSTGAIRDAQKELSEANITLALVTGKPLPQPKGLGVEAAAYLNGLGEAVGEIRRYLLDAMRQGDLSRGEELLTVMDDIYSFLVTIDFPDAITGGLRRTTDMVRGVLERTRSDLTLAMRQKALETRLTEFQQRVSKKAELPQPGLQSEEAETAQHEEPGLDSIEQEIYEALSQWRSRKANEENLAPFIIAHNSWLKQIIKLRPSSIRELNGIKGFGERRVNKYGKEIIAIINRGR
ncbi:MAG TPA: HRDC domain-containing protein [Dehalococcoidales bacterium]|nr:HRDC domain-containing protein [Dehalococcoidales bacterium]